MDDVAAVKCLHNAQQVNSKEGSQGLHAGHQFPLVPDLVHQGLTQHTRSVCLTRHKGSDLIMPITFENILPNWVTKNTWECTLIKVGQKDLCFSINNQTDVLECVLL